MSVATELIDFWFSKSTSEHWFNVSPDFDALVTEKYAELLDNNTQFCDNPLATIILYDQISRHVLRFRGTTALRAAHDQVALNVYNAFGIEARLGAMPTMHAWFALMPLRHTFTKSNLEKCLHIARNIGLGQRFIKATLQALAKINNNTDLLFIDNKDDEDISYVLDKNVYPAYETQHLPTEFLKQLKKANVCGGGLAISVSGGVDSMVCLYLAATYLLNTKVVAISINYGNREAQYDELRMVNRFCTKRGIPHYVRNITEMQRPTDCSWRPFYEAFTKDIRFATYAAVGYPVVLGHNQDDCLENVFSNMKKGINFGNLFGMEHVSVHNSVTVLRPLLNIEKKHILAYAQNHGIPFTADSTPATSERGQLRDNLMPVLRQLGSDFIPGIVKTVQNFNQVYKVYEKSLPSITWHNGYCKFALIEDPGFDYIKRILSIIAETWQISYVSNRSIGHLLSQLGNRTNNLIVLSSNMQSRVKDGALWVYCV
jgi:tRNA(Ile)-lysidine synthetase-like protein